MEARYVKVRVEAGARRESVTVTEKGLKMSVREKAEAGKANGRVRELVARHARVPLSRVHLKSGHTAPSKIFSIDV